MRLIGYIKEVYENSFSIPIYSENEKFYCHTLNDDFKIKSFYETIFSPDCFVQNNTYKDFNINDFGALVFIGFDNNLFFDSADIIIDRINNYINESTNKEKYLLIKEEILDLKNKLFKNDVTVFTDKLENVDIVGKSKRLRRHILKKNYNPEYPQAVLGGKVSLETKIEVFGELNIPMKAGSPVRLIQKTNNDFTINYDVSDINTGDVRSFIRHNQSKNYTELYTNDKYVKLRLILIDFFKFYKIRRLGISSEQTFINLLNKEISSKTQGAAAVNVDYATIKTGDSVTLIKGNLIAGRRLSGNSKK